MTAYQKIREMKIDENNKILVQMKEMNNVPFPTDGGAWIPVFTDNKIEIDFSEYSKPQAGDIYNNYVWLAVKEKKSEALKKIYCEYDIKYIYWGEKQVFGVTVEKNTFDSSEGFTKIFDFGPALYKINALSCK